MSLTFGRAAFVCAAAVGAVLAASAATTIAHAARGTIGTLTCEVEGGKSFIFGSTKDLHCVFRRSKGRSQAYTGKIKKFGIDIGVTGPSTLVWTVIAATSAPTPAELAGKYVGVSAGVAVGIGRELIQFSRERVGYKAPEEIVFLDAMPLNATGKVDRVTLKKLAAGDHAHCA